MGFHGGATMSDLRTAAQQADDLPVGAPLYTTPPRREWQGLTEEEIVKIAVECHRVSPSEFYFARAIEAALKERNT